MPENMPEKPYFWVETNGKVQRNPKSNRLRAAVGSKNYRGVLNVDITAITPVHFGQGDLRTDNDELVYHALARKDNVIALPGSSFKGMIRSLFEVLSGSCSGGRNACGSDAICSACSVFGQLGYKGKLIFSSFALDGSPEGNTEKLIIPALFSPRAGKNGQYKFYKHSRSQEIGRDKLGNTYECLRTDAVLRGTITYEGLTLRELGMLLFSLGCGWEKEIYHKIGYAKPAFFGSVKISVQDAPRNGRYAEFDTKLPDLPMLATEYRESVKDDKLLEAIRKIQGHWSNLDDGAKWGDDGVY